MKKALRTFGLSLLHLVVSTLGVGAAAALIFYGLKPALSFVASDAFLRRERLLVLPGFPFQSLVAMICGCLVAAEFPAVGTHRSARVVWTLPAMWLALRLFFFNQPASILMESRWAYFFTSSAQDALVPQLTTTLPFLTAVWYGIGNYVYIVKRPHPGAKT